MEPATPTLDELERIGILASKAPWRRQDADGNSFVVDSDGRGVWCDSGYCESEDADFIATARNHWQSIIDRCRTAESVIQAARLISEPLKLAEAREEELLLKRAEQAEAEVERLRAAFTTIRDDEMDCGCKPGASFIYGCAKCRIKHDIIDPVLVGQSPAGG